MGKRRAGEGSRAGTPGPARPAPPWAAGLEGTCETGGGMLYSPGPAPSGPGLASGSGALGALLARFLGRAAGASGFLLAATILAAPRCPRRRPHFRSYVLPAALTSALFPEARRARRGGRHAALRAAARQRAVLRVHRQPGQRPPPLQPPQGRPLPGPRHLLRHGQRPPGDGGGRQMHPGQRLHPGGGCAPRPGPAAAGGAAPPRP